MVFAQSDTILARERAAAPQNWHARRAQHARHASARLGTLLPRVHGAAVK